MAMRVRLRPYHPTYVVMYAFSGGKATGKNKDGFNAVLDKVMKDPQTEVELVAEYDDICRGCVDRQEHPGGSVWGLGHACRSSENPDVVDGVNAANALVLGRLGLRFGSVVKWRDLVRMLAEKLPVLEHDFIGGAGRQEDYTKGLLFLLRRWDRADEPPR